MCTRELVGDGVEGEGEADPELRVEPDLGLAPEPRDHLLS